VGCHARRSPGTIKGVSTPSSHQQDEDQPKLISLPEMRYQTGYVWFIFVSSLDIMLTWLILSKGGSEVNPVAKLVIDNWGLAGAIGFKFALALFVIVACEIVGRKRDRLGRNLILFGIIISASPVVYSLYLLLYNWMQGP
jgi:hypothetical protein